jgi:hypothetical protein
MCSRRWFKNAIERTNHHSGKQKNVVEFLHSLHSKFQACENFSTLFFISWKSWFWGLVLLLNFLHHVFVHSVFMKILLTWMLCICLNGLSQLHFELIQWGLLDPLNGTPWRRPSHLPLFSNFCRMFVLYVGGAEHIMETSEVHYQFFRGW